MLKTLFKPDEGAMRPAKLVDDLDALTEYEPLPWSDYFDTCEDVALAECGTGTFRVYGCGEVASLGVGGTLLILVHGAGQCAMVWSRFAAAVKRRGGLVCVAYDARSHGASKHEEETLLSKERLSADCVAIAQCMMHRHQCNVVLVGHSMGGATVVHAARSMLGSKPAIGGTIGMVRGVIVMDVVEGTALASLSHILAAVNSRPSEFRSPNQAVRWSLDCNALRDLESARISIPAQLVLNESTQMYGWRTDLTLTREHWNGWYENMSALFLGLPLPKLLLIAGTDRLDTPLMVGQMQGKFALEILPQCGHQLHEDDPETVAQKVVAYLKRCLGM
jgi:pimeloyl-ACP methyl ester carboxylesterase